MKLPIKINGVVLDLEVPVCADIGVPPAPSPEPVCLTTNYNSYVYLTLRNGYDGDVGVSGYIQSAPFEVYTFLPQTGAPFGPPPTMDEILTTAAREVDGSRLWAGGASTEYPAPNAVPMAIGTTRSFNDTEYGYQQFTCYLPCRETDSLWVSAQPQLNYGGTVVIEVVVGPSLTEGERYTCTMLGGDEPYTRTVSLRRDNNAGARTDPTVTNHCLRVISSNENTLFLPLKALNDEQYASIRLRGMSNQWPTCIYDNGDYPLRKLSVWPIPRTEQAVELWLWEPLSTLPDLDAELNLPQGYERYIRFKLALELAAEFGKEINQDLVLVAEEAEANLKRMNQQVPIARTSRVFRNKPTSNYITFTGGLDTLPEPGDLA